MFINYNYLFQVELNTVVQMELHILTRPGEKEEWMQKRHCQVCISVKIDGSLICLGFPHILENLENNKFIFQVLEVSLDFTKSGNVLEKILPVKNSTYNKKSLYTNIMAVEENFVCRIKRVPLHSLNIPC